MATGEMIQADYALLEGIAQRFATHAEASGQTSTLLVQRMEVVRRSWRGEGANRFIGEMEGDVLPALRRLNEALAEAQRVTLDIVSLMRAAEEEAAALFAITPEKGFWGHVGDFFGGMGAELWDMVSGIGALISDPVGAVEGIWYAINNPSVIWEAIKEPYIEDWNNGRPWRAIGRGVMAILTTILGTKGADKALKLSRGARATRVASAAARFNRIRRLPIDDVISITHRSHPNAVRLGNEAARVANAGGDVSGLVDEIARYSTHAIDTPAGTVPNRVVLGAFREPGVGVDDFYVRQAYPDGGIVYATGKDAWDALNDNITDPVVRRQTQWEVNQRFLQQQMDAGVPRFEYVSSDFDSILRSYSGLSYDEVLTDFLTNPRSAVRFRELEVLYLRDNAVLHGYNLVDNVWIKTP